MNGNIKKIKLHSNLGWFGPAPLPGEEVAQHLTITEKGRIYFSRYDKDKKIATQNSSIAKEQAAKVLAAVGAYFQVDPEEIWAEDAGSWELTITNADETAHHFKGALVGLAPESSPNLTDVIRRAVGVNDLLAFGGGTDPDRCERLYLEYAGETVLVDRSGGSLEYAKRKSSADFFYHLFQDAESVGALLNAVPRFESELNKEQGDYRVSIDYFLNPQKVIQTTRPNEALELLLKHLQTFIETHMKKQQLFS